LDEDEVLATALSIHLFKTGEGLLHACISSIPVNTCTCDNIYTAVKSAHYSFVIKMKKIALFVEKGY
jgi:hypothetical protein